MTEAATSLVVLAILLGAATAGVVVQPLLPETHRSRDTVEAVRLTLGMIVTFAALVLGLLTSSVLASYDAVDSALRGYSAIVIEADQALREYGPGALPIQQMLRSFTAASIADTWPGEPRPPGVYPVGLAHNPDDAVETPTLGEMLERIDLAARQLRPADAMHQRLAFYSLSRVEELVQERWSLIEQVHDSVSVPFLAVLVFWLAIVFFCLGLSAPRNFLTYIVTALCGVALAVAIWVILEFAGPFSGLIQVSSQPMREALAHIDASLAR
ncbi:MAG TPA: hypothetical protein VHY76_08610 [Acetobacteraceae bacterium]|nr:hypothetical protein [Acetobacteraceae bacterium]